MALLSLGAAVENLMVAAADAGVRVVLGRGTDLRPELRRDVLELDPEWLPHAMVVVGRPDPSYVGRPRPPVPLQELRGLRRPPADATLSPAGPLLPFGALPSPLDRRTFLALLAVGHRVRCCVVRVGRRRRAAALTPPLLPAPPRPRASTASCASAAATCTTTPRSRRRGAPVVAPGPRRLTAGPPSDARPRGRHRSATSRPVVLVFVDGWHLAVTEARGASAAVALAS